MFREHSGTIKFDIIKYRFVIKVFVSGYQTAESLPHPTTYPPSPPLHQRKGYSECTKTVLDLMFL